MGKGSRQATCLSLSMKCSITINDFAEQVVNTTVQFYANFTKWLLKPELTKRTPLFAFGSRIPNANDEQTAETIQASDGPELASPN